MSGPMDPERMAKMHTTWQIIAPELLADRDRWEAEARRLAAELDAATREANTHDAENERLWYRVGQLEVEAMRAQMSVGDCARAALAWRARCPVTAEDVERVGVTRAKLNAWVSEQGWETEEHSERAGGALYAFGPKGSVELKWDMASVHGEAWVIAVFIRHAAEDLGRAAHDILDEMAAEVSP